MNNVRNQRYESKQLKNNNLELENDFKLINISIIDMDKFEKKNQQRR